MAIDLTDKTANANTLTNQGDNVVEELANLPFPTSTVAADFESSLSAELWAHDSNSLSLTGNSTIEFWVNFESLPTSGNVMGLVNKWEGTDQDYHVWMYNDSGTTKLQTQISQNGNGTFDGVRFTWAPTLGTWYHVAVTITPGNPSATTFEFFLNGSSQGNGSLINAGDAVSIHAGNADLYIGSAHGSSYFDGKMDDVRIWSTVRTSTQIANNRSVELVGNESNLVGYWTFGSKPRGGAFLLNFI